MNEQEIGFAVRKFADSIPIEAKRKGEELVFKYCPYCHGGQKKSRDTFAINIRTGLHNCKKAGCIDNKGGGLSHLQEEFRIDLGVKAVGIERNAIVWRKFQQPTKPAVPTDFVVGWFEGRGIPEEIVRRYQIRQHSKQADTLVFPFFDDKGVLTYVKYRNTSATKENGKTKEWCEAQTKPILFGMNLCEYGKPLVLTEGQIDSMSLSAAGIPNAVSVPSGKNGMTWIAHCSQWLRKFKEIVVFGDWEDGGMTLLPYIRQRFKWMKVRAVREEDYKGCKDANEILMKHGKDVLVSAVENAAVEVVDRIKDLSIANTGYEAKEVLPTGMREIDKMLMGGLQFGQMHIINGKRGEGKTTLASMFVKSAIENGHKVLIYSGEMSERDVANTLFMQIAGQERTEDRSIDSNGLKRFDYDLWCVKPEAEKTIREWISGKAYIYNWENQYEDDDEAEEAENENLLATIEQSARSYDTRVVIVDNLMTAIDVGNSSVGIDKFERQERLVKDLVRLATKLNILIILIAHNKKGISADGNDDIAGVSEITNLAGVVMGYGRPDTKPENVDRRLLRITKNRATGRVKFDGFETIYNPRCKRIYLDTQDDCNDVSPCFVQSNGFATVYEEDLDIIPF